MCIKLHFYLLFVAVYFYGIHKLNFFMMYYLFAIFHESAHILIAIILKIRVLEIILLPVGVCAKYDYINSRMKEVMIAATGPLFSIAIGIISKDILLKKINYSIAFLNLIPIYPLDGGRILRGILEIILGYRKSIIISGYISKSLLIFISLISIILAVYFKNFSLIILSIYIFFMIKEEVKKDRIIKTVQSFIE